MKREVLRLLDLGRVDPFTLHATYIGLAESLSHAGEGWLILARSERGHIALGASQYADAELDLEACRAQGVPVVQRPLGGGAVWVDDYQLCLFVIVPRQGSRQAFFEQCLHTLADLFQRLGLAVRIVGGQDIWVGGAKLLGSGGATIGGAYVFGTSVLERFSAERFAACVAAPSPGFRRWLADLLAEHMTDLHRLGVNAKAPEILAALRAAVAGRWEIRMAQAPEAGVRAAIHEALEALREPLESGDARQVRKGIKINRLTYLLEDETAPWVRLVWRSGVLTKVAAADADVAKVLEACLNLPLRPGLVSQSAARLGWPANRAAALEQRIESMCRDVATAT